MNAHGASGLPVPDQGWMWTQPSKPSYGVTWPTSPSVLLPFIWVMIPQPETCRHKPFVNNELPDWGCRSNKTGAGRLSGKAQTSQGPPGDRVLLMTQPCCSLSHLSPLWRAQGEGQKPPMVKKYTSERKQKENSMRAYFSLINETAFGLQL